MAALKSAISFGMIYIPITLHKTNREINISFNQIDRTTRERVKYKKVVHDKEIKSEDIIKGFEFDKDQYVTFENDELEKIKSKKDKTIHIEHFSKMSEIDYIYFDKDYYAVPTLGGESAFELLRQAMLSKKVIAIAKTVFGNKEELVALYPTKEGIITKLLFYQEEINPSPSYTKNTVDKAQLTMAKTLIDSMIGSFDITKYKDEYQEKIREAIRLKIEGQQIIQISDEPVSTAIDLMEALQKSLAMTKSNRNSMPSSPN